jgi:hypothetical protein
MCRSIDPPNLPSYILQENGIRGIRHHTNIQNEMNINQCKKMFCHSMTLLIHDPTYRVERIVSRVAFHRTLNSHTPFDINTYIHVQYIHIISI